jgi:hypothetical protein
MPLTLLRSSWPPANQFSPLQRPPPTPPSSNSSPSSSPPFAITATSHTQTRPAATTNIPGSEANSILAGQPPHLPTPLHLPSADTLDPLRPNLHHRCHPLRLLLLLRRCLPRRSAAGLAPQACKPCGRVHQLACACEGWVEGFLRISIYVP